jgi:DNA-binding MarR family transcriptional regulator
MTSGKSSSENLMVLLVRASQAFRDDIDDHLHTTPGVPRVLGELNGGQRRLLTLIPAEGARGTDLAELAGVSKQALGQFASGLEDAGLVRAHAAPGDGRVRIWKLTPAGTKAADAARSTLQAVEKQWRTRLGPTDYDQLAATLKRTLRHERPRQPSART